MFCLCYVTLQSSDFVTLICIFFTLGSTLHYKNFALQNKLARLLFDFCVVNTTTMIVYNMFRPSQSVYNS